MFTGRVPVRLGSLMANNYRVLIDFRYRDPPLGPTVPYAYVASTGVGPRYWDPPFRTLASELGHETPGGSNWSAPQAIYQRDLN